MQTSPGRSSTCPRVECDSGSDPISRSGHARADGGSSGEVLLGPAETRDRARSDTRRAVQRRTVTQGGSMSSSNADGAVSITERIDQYRNGAISWDDLVR